MSKLTNRHSNQNRNKIGQKYEIVSTSTQTSWQSVVSGTPTLTIQFSIESPFSDQWIVDINKNTILMIKCLTLLNILFTTTPEGLEEASEALESMVEYYRESASDWQQISLPQELGMIKGNVLPSEVRPPLVLDFE